MANFLRVALPFHSCLSLCRRVHRDSVYDLFSGGEHGSYPEQHWCFWVAVALKYFDDLLPSLLPLVLVDIQPAFVSELRSLPADVYLPVLFLSVVAAFHAVF